MKLFLSSSFIVLYILGCLLFATTAFAVSPNPAYSKVFIHQQGKHETMTPEGTWCYPAPKVCAVFYNKMKIDADLSFDGQKAFALKPGKSWSVSIHDKAFSWHTVRLLNKGHLFTFIINICPRGPGCTIYSE